MPLSYVDSFTAPVRLGPITTDSTRLPTANPIAITSSSTTGAHDTRGSWPGTDWARNVGSVRCMATFRPPATGRGADTVRAAPQKATCDSGGLEGRGHHVLRRVLLFVKREGDECGGDKAQQ